MKIHCMPLSIKSSSAELLNKGSFSINQFFSGLQTFRHSPKECTVGPSKEESTPINTMYILCKASLSGKGTSFEKCQRFNIMLEIPAHTSSVQILFSPHKHLMRVLRNPKRRFYSALCFRPMVDLCLPEAFIPAGANSWCFSYSLMASEVNSVMHWVVWVPAFMTKWLKNPCCIHFLYFGFIEIKFSNCNKQISKLNFCLSIIKKIFKKIKPPPPTTTTKQERNLFICCQGYISNKDSTLFIDFLLPVSSWTFFIPYPIFFIISSRWFLPFASRSVWKIRS